MRATVPLPSQTAPNPAPKGSEGEEWERIALDRAFLAAAVETSEDAVIGKSLNTGRITHWNLGAELLYGWSAEEIVGQHFSVLVPDDKRAEWDQSQNALTTLAVTALAVPSVHLETVRLCRDGSRVDVSVRVGVVRDPETGKPLGLCSIARDITARKATDIDHDRTQIQDKKIALALQRPMLFQPKEDAFSGLSVHTAYAMASDEALVGGDFWDTFAFNNEHVALVIGDVMGHGLNSAVFTTELKYAMRAYIREHVQPASVLHHMNEYVCQSSRLHSEGINPEGSDAPVCIALAVIVRATGAGVLAIAGMEPPILVRADGQVEQAAAVGLPLGITENENYRQVPFQLELGDTLLLTTDGITEARQGKVFLEAEGLMRLAVEGRRGSLEAMADTILNGAKAFAHGRLHDDAALVLARRVPAV